MVTLVHALRHLSKKRILILGDLVIDSYTLGSVRRISPEAPVPVMQVSGEKQLPGMAGNVALNCKALGSEVTLLARVGQDRAGEHLLELLAQEGIDVSYCIRQAGFSTPSKTRLVVDGQQLMRLDREVAAPLSKEEFEHFLKLLDQLLPSFDLVLLSDYAKGFFSPAFLQAILKRCRLRSLPVLVDPKGTDFSRYAGATMVKPNLHEAIGAAGLPSDASLEQVAKKLLEVTQAEMLMITRGKEGLTLFSAGGERTDFPVVAQEVKDVTGAGDTVLAALACCLASGLSYSAAAQVCNHAASIAIQRFGCAQVGLSDIVKRLLAEDPHYKLFCKDNLFVLDEALCNREAILLVLTCGEGIPPLLYRWMRKVNQDQKALVVYLQGNAANEELIEMLVSLREVAFVVDQDVELSLLCQMTKAEKMYTFLEGQICPISSQELCMQGGK